jgi:hypothetical protein
MLLALPFGQMAYTMISLGHQDRSSTLLLFSAPSTTRRAKRLPPPSRSTIVWNDLTYQTTTLGGDDGCKSLADGLTAFGLSAFASQTTKCGANGCRGHTFACSKRKPLVWNVWAPYRGRPLVAFQIDERLNNNRKRIATVPRQLSMGRD